MITSDVNGTYPFYLSPENITITDPGDSLDLLCAVHDCNSGPFLVIGGSHFGPDDSELVESHCKRMPNVREEDGIWFLRIKSTLSKIQNYVTLSGDEPIPIWCRTGVVNSTISYIHINVNHPMNATTDQTEGIFNSTMISNLTGGCTCASKASQSLLSIIVLILSLMLVTLV